MEINLGLNLIQVIGNLASKQIVEISKTLNYVAGKTSVDKFMDSAAGYGHRVIHGHSADYLPQIFQEHGLSGLKDASIHWFRDLSSPHGVPIPFANEIKNFLGLSPKTSIEWLCLNLGDIVGGVFSIAHSSHNVFILKSAMSAGYLSPWLATSIFAGGVFKITAGSISHNPITVICGTTDVCAVFWALKPLTSLGMTYFKSSETVVSAAMLNSAALGTLSGLISGYVVSKLYENKQNENKKRNFINAACGAVAGGLSSAVSYSATQSSLASIAIASTTAATLIALKEQVFASINKSQQLDWYEMHPDFVRNIVSN